MVRRVLRRALNFEWDLIDPEADEILLGLLAHDNEPPPCHEKPHRRWVYPPMYPQEMGDGSWTRRASDWWEFESYEEYRKKNQERWDREDAERKAREAEEAAEYKAGLQRALAKMRGELLAAVSNTVANAPRRPLTPLPGPPVEKLYLMWSGWKLDPGVPQMIYGGWPAYWWSSRLRR